MEINEQPVLELQVFTVSGKKGVLRGRNEQELRWITTHLRKVLSIPRDGEQEPVGVQS